MQYQDFASLLEKGVDFGLDSSLEIVDFHDHCSVDGFVALPLTDTSPMYARNAVYDICDDATKATIAHLVTCGGQTFDYGAASALMAAAYFANAETGDVQNPSGDPRRDFKFSKDYVVVLDVKLSEYSSKFRCGSALWGGFTHKEEQSSRRLAHLRITAPISAFAKTWVETDEEKDALWRSVAHTSPLERFLKLYHLLELRFDLNLVESIKSLNNNLKGIGKLLNSYSGDKEFDRLLKIVRLYAVDIAFFEAVLSDAFDDPSHHQKWKEILFDYSKESNPYKDDKTESFMNAITAGFSATEWKNHGLAWNYDCLSKFTAYMVYRIRSSIAHFRLGEFLLSSDDEAFVANAAEPILRRIVLAAYTHP